MYRANNFYTTTLKLILNETGLSLKIAIFGKKVLTSAKIWHVTACKVCFSNLLMLVDIPTKFGYHSSTLADFMEGTKSPA